MHRIKLCNPAQLACSAYRQGNAFLISAYPSIRCKPPAQCQRQVPISVQNRPDQNRRTWTQKGTPALTKTFAYQCLTTK